MSTCQIFHIGYSLSTGRLDPNFYDLLASESRLASLIAIAQMTEDGSRYFGPYTSAWAVYQTLEVLRKIFPSTSMKD